MEAPIKIILIGDPHLREDEMEDRNQMIRGILKLIEQQTPDLIVVLGDTLHRFDKMNVYPHTQAVEFFRQLRKYAPLRIIIGNHDRPDNTDYLSSTHPFSACKEWSETVVVDKTYREVFHGYQLLYVPYVFPGRLVEAIEAIIPNWEDNQSRFDLVLMHQEIHGAKMGGTISEIGDKWKPNWPLGASGHIHDYQVLGHNFFYIGTPAQQNFGEPDDKRVGLLYLYKRSQSEKFLENLANQSNKISREGSLIGSYWILERYDLGLSRRRTVEIDITELNNWTPPSISDWFRVRLLGTRAQHQAYGSLINSLLGTYPKIRIKQIYTDLSLHHQPRAIDWNRDTTGTKAPTNQTFFSKLERRVSQEDGVAKIFRKIFPEGSTYLANTPSDQNTQLSFNLSSHNFSVGSSSTSIMSSPMPSSPIAPSIINLSSSSPGLSTNNSLISPISLSLSSLSSLTPAIFQPIRN